MTGAAPYPPGRLKTKALTDEGDLVAESRVLGLQFGQKLVEALVRIRHYSTPLTDAQVLAAKGKLENQGS